MKINLFTVGILVCAISVIYCIFGIRFMLSIQHIYIVTTIFLFGMVLCLFGLINEVKEK
jgi:purine-cytosine permease-like protein